MASERGLAQTRVTTVTLGLWGPDMWIDDRWLKVLERTARVGDSPVSETLIHPRVTPSTTGHEKSRGKLGGPSSKAKYSPMTDSA